jgi:hypothetical protein
MKAADKTKLTGLLVTWTIRVVAPNALRLMKECTHHANNLLFMQTKNGTSEIAPR